MMVAHIRKEFSKKQKKTNYIAKSMAKLLESAIKADANSTSCMIAYQPKAPTGLDRYKKNK